MNIAFLLNGESVALTGVDPTRTALDWLREDRGLTGTKEGCNEGDCGACTVMVQDENGAQSVNACILFLGQLDGKSLTTVEALSNGPDLHPVQEALIVEHGSQCGFCTPGIAMSLATAHLNGDANHDDVLAGNLCRCTGYAPIIRAAHRAANDPVPDGFGTPEGLPLADPDASKEADAARPRSTDALAHALMSNPHATLVAGATDVGLWATKGLKDLNPVIFLGGIEALKQVEVTDSQIHVGAGVSIEMLRSILASDFPHFSEMLRRFASLQVRNAATIGGNIANGSPIGDTPPPLIALGTTLHLRRGDTRRQIALEDFFIDYGKQDRRPGEFIEALSIPRRENALKVYKISKRFDQDISAVLAAIDITTDEGVITRARLAFGGMAGIPKRAVHVERALQGRPWSLDTLTAALPAFSQDFTPLSDMRASARYRLKSCENMLLRYWYEANGDAVSVLEVAP